LFILARALKAIPELKDRRPADLRDIVVEWHRQALPVIGTKDLGVTLVDFNTAWRRAKIPLGAKIMEMLIEAMRAGMLPVPPEAANYDSEAVQELVTLCVELQRRAGEKTFFLPCRTAGEAIGLDHDTANRFLNMLEVDGLLDRVTQGHRGRATEWRWLGGMK
jgi:hypothetical protein